MSVNIEQNECQCTWMYRIISLVDAHNKQGNLSALISIFLAVIKQQMDVDNTIKQAHSVLCECRTFPPFKKCDTVHYIHYTSEMIHMKKQTCRHASTKQSSFEDLWYNGILKAIHIYDDTHFSASGIEEYDYCWIVSCTSFHFRWEETITKYRKIWQKKKKRTQWERDKIHLISHYLQLRLLLLGFMREIDWKQMQFMKTCFIFQLNSR